ncbi:MAG: hypothetical protein IVW54_18525 [Candidatus Binataceae bacterium]|nr:hypothetical protein [Candidatus Binataceae bacterium]
MQRIDSLSLGDHYHLTEEDECYFWGEYTARKGFSYSATNNLIINFKKSPLKRSKPEWRYKEEAIERVVAFFREVLKPEIFSLVTFVPIPPSKAVGHAEYDDRLLRTLRLISQGRNADIRELALQTETITAAHDADVRPRPDDLVGVYEINEPVATPAPQNIFIFDDVLTTGAHFKAMQRVLSNRFQGVRIIGIFIARRVPDTTAIEDFDAL